MKTPLELPRVAAMRHCFSARLTVCALATAIFGHALPACGAGLVINPIFDSTITSDPNATTIENTINSAIQVYEADFLNPITVSIKFQEVSTGLGSSSTFVGDISYTSYRAALASAPSTPTKTTALAHLPAGPNNPVNGNANVAISTANSRALGFNLNPPSGQPDGTISLNTSLMNLSRNSIDPAKFDLMAVASHEIDETLGFASALNGLANGDPAPTGSVSPLDLFRYDQNGNRSTNTAINSQAFFSLDGTTQLARFNQDAGGDFSDWFSTGPHTAQVQDAFATAGATPNLGVELTGLDAIGYEFQNQGAVPEPSAAVLAALGGVLLALFHRSSRK
jgi:hypothetical protein